MPATPPSSAPGPTQLVSPSSPDTAPSETGEKVDPQLQADRAAVLEAPALRTPYQLAAALTFSEERIGHQPPDAPAASPADSHTSKFSRKFSIDTPDIVALGILFLAMSAALVAVIVALGFVFGKASGEDTVKIVGTCVGGSTISGIVAALVGRKPRSRR